MAETLAPHTPLIIEDVALKLDGVDYATACDSITIVPTTTKVRWKPVNGRKSTKVAKPDWALTLNVGQDFDKAGLSAQLIQRHGESVTFELSPASGSVEKITGSVTLEAGQFGGASEAVATAAVTLDVDGQPVFAWRDGSTTETK